MQAQCNGIFLSKEVLEEEIQNEMASTKGTFIDDGMTKDGTHYVGLYAEYVLNERKKDKALRIFFLAYFPMPQMEVDGIVDEQILDAEEINSDENEDNQLIYAQHILLLRLT